MKALVMNGYETLSTRSYFMCYPCCTRLSKIYVIFFIAVSFFMQFVSLQALMQSSSSSPYLLNRPLSWNTAKLSSVQSNQGEIKIAFWNVQIHWVTDQPTNLAKYPQYAWKKRLRPISELIMKDSPDVLGLCEYNLVQAQDLKETLEKEGYSLIGFSSETMQSIDKVAEVIASGNNLYYGEFVGFSFKRSRVQLMSANCYALERGERHGRVLVVASFQDLLTQKHFVVLSSHFDHLSEMSRQRSATTELSIIQKLEEQKIPGFSLSDRNWYPDDAGQKNAELYVSRPYIVDFRDETKQGHYGPSGTFVGHLGLESNHTRPVIKLADGLETIFASSVDVCFRSRNLVTAINSYCYTGEFDPITYELLLETVSGDLSKRNFASDHYYVGGTFRFHP